MSEVADRLHTALADRYTIERELGRGGMAIVYLAEDHRLERQVAIKVLRPELTSVVAAERFLREIKLTANLHHPHILPLHEAGKAHELLYYVMPYVEGESLRAKLEREGWLPVEEAVRITREVADALSYAHERDLLHRDIKPENILLEAGHAVVADFGIARALREAGGDRLTDTGVSIGTPSYMSPEQAAGNREVDERTDIYSLACVLYEMLAGEPPFAGDTALSVIFKHMNEPPPYVRAARPNAPAWLEKVIQTALAKKAADRFPTSDAFAEALVTETAPRATLGRVLRRNRRRILAASVVIAITVGAGLLAVGAFDLDPGSRPGAPTAAATLDPARVAVLYFEDESEDEQLGSLCAAFTRKLIHELSRVEALDVISYNGIKSYRDSEVTPDSLARAFGVGTIVEASVAESGGQLRVLAQLIDATTARVLDSREIERPRGETFALLDDVTREVSEFLRHRLGIEIRLQERMAETESVQAWTLVQQAEHLRDDYMPLVRSGDTTGAALMLQRADTLLARAAILDPGWEDPAVLRGWLAWEIGGLRSNVPGKHDAQWIKRGLEHAERALKLHPGDAAALELRGTLQYGLWQTADSSQAAALLAAAERDLRAAVKVDPSRAGAWNSLSTLLHLAKADFRGAKAAAERAYEEDEFLEEAKEIIRRLANLSLELREYDDAIRWTKEGRRRFPNVVDFAALELLTLTMSQGGPEPDVEKAWELREDIRELSPPHLRASFVPLATVQVAAVLARAGEADSAIAVIEGTRADASDDVLAFMAYDEAHAWLLLGDRARALDALALHLEHEPSDKAYIASDPWFADLRGDPRFEALVGS